jgi:hypothetical protein
MALHTPTHQTGLAGHQHLRDLLVAISLAIVLLLALALASTVRVTVDTTGPMSAEQQSLIEFRAGERADWAAGVPTEGSSLIKFRADERSGR